ncbi:uncharacterized protein LOC135942349 [Cloeon dipterum]|uniref:uncharacterized protein LOC135942349 n=1 Tax=Cloeon dipterum TaxID=197152 RepID=UPI0032200036
MLPQLLNFISFVSCDPGDAFAPLLRQHQYNALHWAAKQGNLDVIKLIAGTYQVSPNVRSVSLLFEIQLRFATDCHLITTANNNSCSVPCFYLRRHRRLQRGGQTPLHLAVQFGHDDVRDLLVNVYGADVDIRDYSGKKAAQYERPKSNSESTETINSKFTVGTGERRGVHLDHSHLGVSTLLKRYATFRASLVPISPKLRPRARPKTYNSPARSSAPIQEIKSRKKSSDKDLRFLRIGSLNVRVKRTTEAFSNFFHHQHNNERIHKTWGSADNIQESEQNAMPPPKTLPKSSSKRRRPRRSPSAASIQVVSKPVAVSLPVSAVSLEHINLTSNLPPASAQDSDSDTACGFGDSWK